MTTKILIDTCVWLDLAKDYRAVPVLTAIEDLVDADAIQLIVPETIPSEFARNKDRVVDDTRRGLSSHFKRVREAITQFGENDTKSAALLTLTEIDHKLSINGDMAKRTVETIEKLFVTGPTIDVSDSAKLKAADRALAKIAPFHLAKNSMADAIHLEVYAEAMAAETDQETAFVFVSSNYRDFSQHNGDRRLPHDDLVPLFPKPKSTYSINIVDVIRAIDGEMLDNYEFEHNWQEQPRRLSEILDAQHLLSRQVWYNRHWGLRTSVEDGETEIITNEEFRKLDGYHPYVVVDKIWKGALAAAKKTEDEIGLDNLGPWSDFEWGMINGKLSALRWVTGDEWDMLDT
ncbi:PIN domain-containing protein [Rhizobium herbae]|uniref:DUF4935 domain-containing protein n=1 Tax=Rhizobium herbae TaxID=508661 RepID=A0ABS4EW43_9HYPH|nr:PIN domain-containing protein [Rhizobium herbae]MBP1862152.1 hypothetical protein [Rhizobium herbae]